ncbi:MAG: hypothetical protein EOO61_09820 [Hymenobacter sp.]|nr:MAG: hypothetical protein EOO61_09820 [Hymenobacter sp.]
MYIESVDIQNIRVLKSCKLTFAEPAGWHVIIGDNGTGKSTLMRAISLGLIGPAEAKALRSDFSGWLRKDSETAEINLTLSRDQTFDGYAGKKRPLKRPFEAKLKFIRQSLSTAFNYVEVVANNEDAISPANYIWSSKRGWFSAGFGPFRRLHGGDTSLSKIYSSSPKAAAHFSLFNEDLALTEALSWLKENDYRWLKLNEESEVTRPGDSDLVAKLKLLINSQGLLPHGAQFLRMGTDGPVFQDANGERVDVVQMSDGFRAILSVAFELIRQLVEIYGLDEAFQGFDSDNIRITVPGVVLIDEVDIHLHPTWQEDIGSWFTTHFPNIQFIVTTHSPLVCRAAGKGSIHRLARPGSDENTEEIIGIERDRLIYGNILDAYATDAFGEDVTQSAASQEKLEKLIQMNRLYAYGKLPKAQEEEMYRLRKIFTTDDTFEL